MRKLTSTVVFLALWVGAILGVGPLGYLAVPVYTIGSGVYGYVIKRWWAPLVVFGALPALLLPEAYGHNEPNYSNAIVFVLIVVPLGLASVAAGILVGKAVDQRRARKFGPV